MRFILMTACLFAIASSGCKKPAAPTVPTAAPPAPAPSGGGGGGGGGGNTGFVSGGGAAQNVRQAARRTITINDMKTLGQLIEIDFTQNGKMPGLNEVKESLKRDSPTILAAINEGTIILCWTAQHEGIWAYEIDADTKGGIAVVTGTASRYDAEQVKQLLGK